MQENVAWQASTERAVTAQCADVELMAASVWGQAPVLVLALLTKCTPCPKGLCPTPVHIRCTNMLNQAGCPTEHAQKRERLQVPQLRFCLEQASAVASLGACKLSAKKCAALLSNTPKVACMRRVQQQLCEAWKE
jgi:hypothetical protein